MFKARIACLMPHAIAHTPIMAKDIAVAFSEDKLISDPRDCSSSDKYLKGTTVRTPDEQSRDEPETEGATSCVQTMVHWIAISSHELKNADDENDDKDKRVT
jgi:hypothetical protein